MIHAVLHAWRTLQQARALEQAVEAAEQRLDALEPYPARFRSERNRHEWEPYRFEERRDTCAWRGWRRRCLHCGEVTSWLPAERGFPHFGCVALPVPVSGVEVQGNLPRVRE